MKFRLISKDGTVLKEYSDGKDDDNNNDGNDGIKKEFDEKNKSGNPYLNIDIEKIREICRIACFEIANGLHLNRMNKLHYLNIVKFYNYSSKPEGVYVGFGTNKKFNKRPRYLEYLDDLDNE